jgi:hypothetical protein
MISIEHPIISALHAAARATTAYPVDLLAARRADFRAQIEAAQPVAPWTADAWQAGECDPRTQAERDLDEWQAEWRETYSSLRDDMCKPRRVAR